MESAEVFTSPPAHRTRNALKHLSHVEIDEEVVQNIRNYSYEYEQHHHQFEYFGDNSSNNHHGNSSYGYCRKDSVSCSDKSNDSFADSVLADSSKLSAEGGDHLPYRLYKYAVEYWNKYPKTDYTYSHFSRDRVELAPGQVAVPNMSRLSLGQYRQGMPVYSGGLSDQESAALYDRVEEIRKRSTKSTSYFNRNQDLADSDYDEPDNSTKRIIITKRWWITELLISLYKTVVSSVSAVNNRLFRSNYDNRRSYYTNYYMTTTTTESDRNSKLKNVYGQISQLKWPLLILGLFLLPLLYYWLFGFPLLFMIGRNNTSTEPVTLKQLHLNEELMQAIILRLKDNMPEQKAVEQFEARPSVDFAIQQELIDKLYLEIEDLKVQLLKYSNLEEEILSMISKHHRDTLVKILGVSDISNENLKQWLKKEVRLEETIAKVKNDFADLLRVELSQSKSAAIMPSESGSCNCEDVHRIVTATLAIYDADKTGKVDYALESAGGQIVSIRCTEPYQPSSATFPLLRLFFWYPSVNPQTILTPGASPGECWAFQGFPGRIVIKLLTRIFVTGFTVEHTPVSLSHTGRIDSAPKKFFVMGLQDEMDPNPVTFGTYEYRNDSTPIQYFPVKESAGLASPSEDSLPGHQLIELQIDSNHGHPHYTCLYRFRVHGDPVEDIPVR